MTLYSFFYYGVNTMGLHKIGQTKHIRQRKSRLSRTEGLTMVAIYKVREHDKHSASASKVIEALARYNLVKNGYENIGNDHFSTSQEDAETVNKIINTTIKEASEKLGLDITEM